MRPFKPTNTSVSTTKISVYTLDGTDIIALVKNAGVIIPEGARVDVTFRIPGGGDWSNTTLDIDSDNPIHVKVTESN